MEKVGQPDSPKNMENALHKDFPTQTTSPLQRDHDGDDITRAKICGPITFFGRAVAEASGSDFGQNIKKYDKEPLTPRKDVSPPVTPTGTRNLK
jgi:hypothetical protein